MASLAKVNTPPQYVEGEAGDEDDNKSGTDGNTDKDNDDFPDTHRDISDSTCIQTTRLAPLSVQFPAGSFQDFSKWGSCGTMPLVSGFSRGCLISPALVFRHCSMLLSLHPHRPPRPLHFTLTTTKNCRGKAVANRLEDVGHEIVKILFWEEAHMKARAVTLNSRLPRLRRLDPESVRRTGMLLRAARIIASHHEKFKRTLLRDRDAYVTDVTNDRKFVPLLRSPMTMMFANSKQHRALIRTITENAFRPKGKLFSAAGLSNECAFFDSSEGNPVYSCVYDYNSVSSCHRVYRYASGFCPPSVAGHAVSVLHPCSPGRFNLCFNCVWQWRTERARQCRPYNAPALPYLKRGRKFQAGGSPDTGPDASEVALRCVVALRHRMRISLNNFVIMVRYLKTCGSLEQVNESRCTNFNFLLRRGTRLHLIFTPKKLQGCKLKPHSCILHGCKEYTFSTSFVRAESSRQIAYANHSWNTDKVTLQKWNGAVVLLMLACQFANWLCKALERALILTGYCIIPSRLCCRLPSYWPVTPFCRSVLLEFGANRLLFSTGSPTDFRIWESCPGLCRCSAGFLEDLPFPLPLHSGAAPYPPNSNLSTLHSTLTDTKSCGGSFDVTVGLHVRLLAALDYWNEPRV
ncbi:hypothetical protein PR048_017146 [Dryococelus australis]|uniref:Uncharacterized protein n=1 Tax=Dryococelus australis TaxID=614101 RepID=A0ABQ9H8U1_9NEOP|nr:hypothetical protein PR048_017146 [Dryococelus australis]